MIINKKIDLVEALCGFKHIIKTLDDRELVITSHAGEFQTVNRIKSNIKVLCIVAHVSTKQGTQGAEHKQTFRKIGYCSD